jgi:hypothetical protein
MWHVATGRIKQSGGPRVGDPCFIYCENRSHILFKWVYSCFLLENSWILGSTPRPSEDLERFCVVTREKCWFVTLKQATGPTTFFNLLFRITLTLYPTSSVQSLNCYIIHRYMHIVIYRTAYSKSLWCKTRVIYTLSFTCVTCWARRNIQLNFFMVTHYVVLCCTILITVSLNDLNQCFASLKPFV